MSYSAEINSHKEKGISYKLKSGEYMADKLMGSNGSRWTQKRLNHPICKHIDKLHIQLLGQGF